MEPKRHVSRWHTASSSTTTAASNEPADTQLQQPEVSLRYLNEFVGKLQCASALLDHKLFPDAKEITEVRVAISSNKAAGQSRRC